MGSTWKSNKAFSHILMKAVIGKIENKIVISRDENESHKWIVFAAYVLICYVVSLRGNEGLMLELGSLRKHWILNSKIYNNEQKLKLVTLA